MIAKTNSIKDICLRYRSPETKVIEVKVQHVLCGSLDNEPMGENDVSNAFGQD